MMLNFELNGVQTVFLKDLLSGHEEMTEQEMVSVRITVVPHARIIIQDAESYAAPLQVTIDAQNDSEVSYQWTPGLNHVDAREDRTIIVQCSGAGSVVSVKCACMTQGKQKTRLVTRQEHSASHTKSTVTIHGVSKDRSRMDVESMVHIGADICGISAHQMHKHLLLDQGARATSEPMLEVLSDDVSCGHGSAICHINQDHILYLQSRGYTEADAKAELVRAFLTV